MYRLLSMHTMGAILKLGKGRGAIELKRIAFSLCLQEYHKLIQKIKNLVTNHGTLTGMTIYMYHLKAMLQKGQI